jgi:hypothetical protein
LCGAEMEAESCVVLLLHWMFGSSSSLLGLYEKKNRKTENSASNSNL